MTAQSTLFTPPQATSGTPKVIGLDLSLTSTGIASNACWFDTIKPPAKLRGHERMAWLRARILDHTRGADLVVVEGPSYGSHSQTQAGHHERAGLWWLITHAMWSADVHVAVASPKSLKLYATGKGNASKDAVLSEVVRRFGWFRGDNNSADATVLAAMGAEHLGLPIVSMPQTHRAALAGVAWPEVAS